jgi:hypothetical protein
MKTCRGVAAMKNVARCRCVLDALLLSNEDREGKTCFVAPKSLKGTVPSHDR